MANMQTDSSIRQKSKPKNITHDKFFAGKLKTGNFSAEVCQVREIIMKCQIQESPVESHSKAHGNGPDKYITQNKIL